MAIVEFITKYVDDFDWSRLKDRKVQLAIVGGVFSVYYVWKQLTKKRYNLPPGPTPLPLVGNLLVSGTSNMHLKYTEYAKKYGPVFTFYLGPQRAVILNDLQSVKEAFVTKGVDFADRPPSNINDIFTDNGKDIAGAQYGPIWKIQRKIAHAALRKYTTGEKITELLKYSFDLVTKKIDEQEGPIVVAEWNMLYIYNVFSTLCFGRVFELDDPYFVKLKTGFMSFSDLGTDVVLVDAFPILNSRFYETKGVKFLKDLLKEIYGLFQKEYAEHEATYDPSNLDDFMYDLIDLRKKSEKDKDTHSVLSEMTQMHFLQICLDIFFAGTDTTRLTMTFVMLYAGKYPELQKKIHNEIDDIVGKDGNITLRVKDQLHYLHAFLYEVMRVAPVAPVGLPHATRCDTKIGKFDIPEGTMVIANTWAVHYDSSVPDLAHFNPNRWLTKDGTFDHQLAPFVPFSMGTRNCVGESLAKVELMIALALFFQKYTFEIPAGETASLEPEDLGGGLGPKPFKVNLIQRT